MSILGDLDETLFLRDYWQQQPLLIRNACQNYADAVTPDDLAWLASETEAESRLIQRHESDKWSLEQGPFDIDRFSHMPADNWTLLVQSVDQWVPELQALLSEFHFLPSWRLDDLMISYAATGGGVGPHFDYYDVFLLQTRGCRHWQLGQKCDSSSVLLEHQPLKLLREFECAKEYRLEPGDMLYIPAGLAHWGTALDSNCMTWSIGFRAPSLKELLETALGNLIERLPDELRYRDSSATLKAAPSEFSAEVADQLQDMLASLDQDWLQQAMMDALGSLSTEPRNPELFEPEQEISVEQLRQAMQVGEQKLEWDGSGRLAFRKTHDGALLYANGERFPVNISMAKKLCDKSALLEDFDSESGLHLLAGLMDLGLCRLIDG